MNIDSILPLSNELRTSLRQIHFIWHTHNTHISAHSMYYTMYPLKHTKFHYSVSHLLQFRRPPAKPLRAWTSRRHPRTTLKPYPPTQLHPVCPATRTQCATSSASSSNHVLATIQQRPSKSRGQPAATTTALSVVSILSRW